MNSISKHRFILGSQSFKKRPIEIEGGQKYKNKCRTYVPTCKSTDYRSRPRTKKSKTLQQSSSLFQHVSHSSNGMDELFLKSIIHFSSQSFDMYIDDVRTTIKIHVP